MHFGNDSYVSANRRLPVAPLGPKDPPMKITAPNHPPAHRAGVRGPCRFQIWSLGAGLAYCWVGRPALALVSSGRERPRVLPRIIAPRTPSYRGSHNEQ
jgi:hypothetical protein